MAILVDVCTQAFRMEKAVDKLVRGVRWQNKQELAHNIDQMREAIYVLDIVNNRLPKYSNLARVEFHQEDEKQRVLVRPY